MSNVETNTQASEPNPSEANATDGDNATTETPPLQVDEAENTLETSPIVDPDEVLDAETQRNTDIDAQQMQPQSVETAADDTPSEAEIEPEPEPDPLAEAIAERDKFKEQLLRTAADFENFRKRSRKDLQMAERRGREEVLRDILTVIDNLERAVAAATDASTVASIREGVVMVLKQFEDISGRMGLSRVETIGQRFDPALHDAIQQQETDEHPPGTIVNEIMPGYRLNEKLLRAAMVVVARKPAEETTEG